jgi:tight adherence protein B
MTMLIAGFALILLMSFVTVLVATRPSRAEKALIERLVAIPRTGEGASALVGREQLLKTGNVSRFSWLEQVLEHYSFSQRLQLQILQAHSSATAGGIVMGSLASSAACFAIMYYILPVTTFAVAAAMLGSTVPYIVLGVRRSRRIDAFNKALPDCIDMMGRALRAGHSIVAAIEMVSEQSAEPARSEFSEVFKQQNYGLPLRDALSQLIERVPSQDLRVLVTGILVQRETGGNLAEILDRTASVIRERLRIQGEIRTQTAQGRMTGWILGLLPVIMLVFINIADPGYSRILFEEGPGRKLLYIGIVLLAMGAAIMRQIIHGIEV